ncbi:hypothetical protein [Blastopirellula marina]|uniref:Uncharacterized protein n=1 Tax=Blastopirellula marina DSM 3645 TaxID=314230 RepID=A3ZXL0_9BACT|nr:hypothetical protein [Blastopirellula marina]EAQ78805.1 hypothetical protein DSM3645_29926 [Blastopirellula marina DSM 3645]
MAELEEQVGVAASELKIAWTTVKNTANSSLPTKCFEHWEKRAKLHELLTRTIPVFKAREKAWEVVQGVAFAEELNGKPGLVSYGGIEMEFAVARHLALTSYVSVTWSIYDRLANVCGRLSGVREISEHPKQNPKLCEDLLGEKNDEKGKPKKNDTLGFGGHLHIYAAYAWPIKVSYKVRNWLVHEGYEDGTTALFEGDRIADRFMLSNDALGFLQKACGGDGNGQKKGDAICVQEAEDSWLQRDLLKIIEQYNKEIDTMFVALLKWSAESLTGQIKAFAARDQQ